MRIMLDTNVLLSAVIFRSKMMWNMMARIMEDHRLVLSSYVIDECYEVVERKKPSLIQALDRLFESIPFDRANSLVSRSFSLFRRSFSFSKSTRSSSGR